MRVDAFHIPAMMAAAAPKGAGATASITGSIPR